MTKDVIKNIVIGFLTLSLIVLIIFRIQVNVSMKQSQTQTMKTDIWNTANNQNINLNVLHTYSTGRKLVFKTKQVESILESKLMYDTLSPFQKMYTHAISVGGITMIIYPVLEDDVKVNHISVSNFSTNRNTNYVTNLLWVDWK